MSRDYSQHGESVILKELFDKIGTTNKFAVEFGAGNDDVLSNTKMFEDGFGWKRLLMDIEPGKPSVKKEVITPDNINELLRKYECPEVIDLISIDIDGNDYWVLKNLDWNIPVIIIEYNSHYGINEKVVMERTDSGWRGGETSYSASYKAMKELAQSKGYFLYKEVGHNNLIFVQYKFIDLVKPFDDSELVLPNNWGFKKNELRKMIQID